MHRRRITHQAQRQAEMALRPQEQIVGRYAPTGHQTAPVGIRRDPIIPAKQADDMRRIFRRIAELKKLRQIGENDQPEILITFDDGNVSDLTIALPELLKNGLRAEFFVCAGRLNDPNYLDEAGIRAQPIQQQQFQYLVERSPDEKS